MSEMLEELTPYQVLLNLQYLDLRDRIRGGELPVFPHPPRQIAP